MNYDSLELNYLNYAREVFQLISLFSQTSFHLNDLTYLNSIILSNITLFLFICPHYLNLLSYYPC